MDLARADETINATYGALKARLDPPGRLALRDAQRAWLRRRDAVCGLGPSNGDRASSGGLDVKLGRPDVAWVSTSVAMDRALAMGEIAVNLGQRPFAYALPDGYRPMDTAPATVRREVRIGVA